MAPHPGHHWNSFRGEFRMSETTERIIDRRELLALVPYSYSQIARMEKTGDFPRRLQLSRGRVGYSFHEVLRWIETRKASRQDATSNAPSIDAASPVEVPPAIDFEEAGRFLRILDPHTDKYSFWCFYDVAEIAPKEPHLAAMLHVSLEDGAGLLTDDSRRGASISVMINET